MPDPYGNPLPGERLSGGQDPLTNFGGAGGMGIYGAGGGNQWLRSAVGNTGNPQMDFDPYLTGLGFDIDADRIGKYFSGIQEGYQEDVGMARAGFAQGMQGMQSQATGQAMQLGGGQGLSSAYNPGFGKAQYGIQQGLQGIQQQYGQGMQGGLLDFTQQKLGAQRDAQSEMRSIATGLIGQDAAGISYGGGTTSGTHPTDNFLTAPTDLAGWNPPSGGDGTDYQFGGDSWIKFGGQWISEDEYDWQMSQDRDS